MKILEDLIITIRNRKILHKSLIQKITRQQKTGSGKGWGEIKELIEAVNKNDNKIHEAADVLYHLIVYLETNNIKIEDVLDELERRKK